VLLITGPVGVGKTSVAFETTQVLEERGLAHAFFDLDGLTYFHPKPADDSFGEGFALDALGLLVPGSVLPECSVSSSHERSGSVKASAVTDARFPTSRSPLFDLRRRPRRLARSTTSSFRPRIEMCAPSPRKSSAQSAGPERVRSR
jgi:hypothetical protein